MPLDTSTFKTRTFTAVVFAVVMIAGLLINQYTFLLLFSGIHFGCWQEYQRLIAHIDADYKSINSFHRYGVIIAGWGFMLWMTNDAFNIGELSFYEIGWWLMLIILIALPLTEVLLSKQFNLKNLGYSLLGLIYISLSWGLMVNLRSGPSVPEESFFNSEDFLLFTGLIITLSIIASIWINDTMAYMVGATIGKTPLTKISPKKTWEGTLGGLLLTIITVTLLAHFALNADYLPFMIISAIAVLFGTAGDLFESKLKRMAGVKDSGTILPGHGGFLDRFDSMMMATPFVWLYVKLFL